MQYLLTPEEYNELINKDTDQANLLSQDLQDVCTYAANEVPIIFWGRTTATPWGCILSTEDEWYCDECPVEQQCPHDDKQWSK